MLNKYFEPNPGLYAAGEVAGMAGGHINGKAGLEGTMLGPSIFSGRFAGAWAAHEAGLVPDLWETESVLAARALSDSGFSFPDL